MAFFGEKDDGGKGRDGGAAKGGDNFLTKNAGPLPMWGWIAVGVSAVFLFRIMVKPKPAEGEASEAAQAAPVPYPTGGVGGVFLIPSGTGSPPSTQPPPGPTPPPPPPAASSSLAQILQQVAAYQKGILESVFAGATSITGGALHNVLATNQASAISDAMGLRGGDGTPTGENFLRATAAAKAAGLPHVITTPGGAAVFNPRTGQSIPVTSFNGMDPAARGRLQSGVGWETINVNTNAA